MLQLLALLQLLVASARGIQYNMPILYMKLVDFPTYSPWPTNNPINRDIARMFTAIHWEQLAADWSIERVYAAKVKDISNEVYGTYIELQTQVITASSLQRIDYYWSYQVPEVDVHGSLLNDHTQVRFETFGKIQELLLANISSQMGIDLERVASRLGVSVRNLSYSYDPANWEHAVHVMVDEAISVFLGRLDLRSVATLAKLVHLVSNDLQNATISTFLEKVPPLYPKKNLLDKNTTREILASLGLPEDPSLVTVGMLVNRTTGISGEDFGVLYNLTESQYRVIARATFLQMSQTCGISVSRLFDSTLPNVSWTIAGSMFFASPCPIIVRVKGISINSIGVANPESKTALDLLLAVTNEPWRRARITESLPLDEWSCLDSTTVTQVSQLENVTLDVLLNRSSVSDLISRLKANGLCSQVSAAYRQTTMVFLTSFFNTTSQKVATLAGMTNFDLRLKTAPKLVEIFINTTISELNISLSDVLVTLGMTPEEMFNIPTKELQDILPNIITVSVMLQVSKLGVSLTSAYHLMGVYPQNGTIAKLSLGIQIVSDILAKKRKFERDTFGSYLINTSTTDASFAQMTVLSALLGASGFASEQLKLVYQITSEKITILEKLKIGDLLRYCRSDISLLKSETPFAITGNVVGIPNTKNASCKATKFYVAAKSLSLNEAGSVCSFLSNQNVSLMRLTEHCSGLTWRYNADLLNLRMQDWTANYLLTLGSLPRHSNLTALTLPEKTFQELLHKAVAANPEEVQSIRDSLRGPILNDLLSLFGASLAEVANVLGISESTVNAQSLVGVVEKVLQYLKTKYSVDFSSVVSVVGLPFANMKYLSPTEWSEIITPLKQEILQSGTQQLNVTESVFQQLLLFSNISSLPFAQLKTKWDMNFTRILKGKILTESKTMNEIATLMSIYQDLNTTTVMKFFEAYLNLTRGELSTIYNIDTLAVDILSGFTFKDLPSSCGLSNSQVYAKTPEVLLRALTGTGDISTCRNVALMASLRYLTINFMATKFSIAFNITISVLDFLESTISLPWDKIAWGLDVSVSDWTLIGAVSVKDIANISSTSAASVTSSKTFLQLAAQIRAQITSLYKSKYQQDLIQLASSVFALNSTEVCGACEISSVPSISILKVFLVKFATVIYFDENSLPSPLGYTTDEFWLLVPSKWPSIVPLIKPKAYANASILLGVTEEELSTILGGPNKSEILDLELSPFVDLIRNNVTPLIVCAGNMNFVPVTSLASSKGIPDTSLSAMSVLSLVGTLCPGVPLANVYLVQHWSQQNVTILGNYTLEDVKTCKWESIAEASSRTILALASVVLNEVHGCPPPTLPPCQAGTVRDATSQNCTDVDECADSAACQAGQNCLNLYAWFQCVCETPGYDIIAMLCKKARIYVLIFTLPDETYNSELQDTRSQRYAKFKEKLEKECDDIFKNSLIRTFFGKCTIMRLREGSVIVTIRVSFGIQFTGTLADIRKAFIDGLNTTNGATYLGNTYRIITPSVADYNECENHDHNCHQDATCVNEIGSFSCKCKSGFDGDGFSCKPGFVKTFWWVVILLGLALMVVIIIIAILIIKKPKRGKFRSGVNYEGERRLSRGPSRRSNASSTLSYRDGDVYYRDSLGSSRTRTGKPDGIHSSLGRENPVFDANGEGTPNNYYDNNIRLNDVRTAENGHVNMENGADHAL